MRRHDNRTQSKFPAQFPVNQEHQQEGQQHRAHAPQNKQYMQQQTHHISGQQGEFYSYYDQQEKTLQRNHDQQVGKYNRSYGHQERQSFINQRQQPYPDYRKLRKHNVNDDRYNEQAALKCDSNMESSYRTPSNDKPFLEQKMHNPNQYPQTKLTKQEIHTFSQRKLEDTHSFPNFPSQVDESNHVKSNVYQTGSHIPQNTEMSHFSTEKEVSSCASSMDNNKWSMIGQSSSRYTQNRSVRPVLQPPFPGGLNRPRYRQIGFSQNMSSSRFPHQEGMELISNKNLATVQSDSDSRYLNTPTFQGQSRQHLPHHFYIDQSTSSHSHNQPETSTYVSQTQHVSTSVANVTQNEHTHMPHFERDTIFGENGICNQDKLWLQEWLKQKGINRKQKTDCKILLPEAQSLLKSALTMQQDLKSVLKKIKDIETRSVKTQEYFKQAEELKSRLEEVKKVLGSAKIQEILKHKMVQARKKRNRKKRKRKMIYEEKISMEERRKQMHEDIDKWQESVIDKIEAEKREKELKTIADKALAEVRHKTMNVTKGLEVLQSLRKLRIVRKDSKERKGLYTSKNDDHMFEVRLRMLVEFLQEQLKNYEAEKNMIQVMLDTEQEECQEYEKEELQRNKEEKAKELENNIKEYLFGKEATQAPSSPGHPMYSFHMYYDSANQSVDNLCAIRHEWDQFIVDRGLYEGSCIPSTWLIPNEPSSEAWGSALKHGSG